VSWRLARKFLEAVIAGLVGGFVLLVMVPIVFGWRPYTVLTGSMRPVIQPGDVVMDQPISVMKMHVGDVVTFSDPTRHGDLVTHRIRSLVHDAQQTRVQTRGDANNTSENWTIDNDQRVGRVVYTLPKVGHFAVWVRSPVGLIVLIVIPVLLFGFSILRSIWKEDDEDDGAEDDERGDPEPEVDSSSVSVAGPVALALPAPVAQWIERLPPEQEVGRSNRPGRAKPQKPCSPTGSGAFHILGLGRGDLPAAG
jgi:signal peptidase